MSDLETEWRETARDVNYVQWLVNKVKEMRATSPLNDVRGMCITNLKDIEDICAFHTRIGSFDIDRIKTKARAMREALEGK